MAGIHTTHTVYDAGSHTAHAGVHPTAGVQCWLSHPVSDADVHPTVHVQWGLPYRESLLLFTVAVYFSVALGPTLFSCL